MAKTGWNARSGGCLCGSVTYAVDTSLEQILQCHCENCRRLTGNFVAAARAATADLELTDRDGTFDWFDLGYARYGFCRGCGSTLFYRADDRQELTAIMVGTLDDASGLKLGAVWYADEAQAHNLLPPDVPHHPGNS